MKELIIVSLCLLASVHAVAQDSSGAEAAVLKYGEAAKAYDTAAMTALMHPDALKRFRTTINEALAGSKGDQAKAELLPLFSVATAAAYSALSDREAFKRLNDTVAKTAPELVEASGLMLPPTADAIIVGIESRFK